MKKFPTIFAEILLIVILFPGCDRPLEFETPELESMLAESDPEPGLEDDDQNILKNGDVELGAEQPDSWYSCIVGYDDYKIYRTAEYHNSPSHSLKISVDKVWSIDSFAYWKQSIPCNTPPLHEYILTVCLRLENVMGQGIAIAVRGDDTTHPSGAAEAFYTTQHKISIIGTEDWKEYNLMVTDMPPDVKSMTIYLLFLPKTTGTVYFDDITLKAAEPS